MTWIKWFVLIVSVIASGVAGYGLRVMSEHHIRPHTHYTFDDKISDPQGGGLMATGTWRGADLASPVNVVRIWCERTNQTCELHQVDMTTFGTSAFLTLHSTTFLTSQVDTKLLTAVNESAVCVRQTLVVDRQAQTVSLVRTKRNSQDMCSAVQDEPFTISLADPRFER